MKQSNIIRQTILSSKKIALMVALFLTVGISYSFASPTDEVNGDIRISFRKNFRDAQIIGSEVTNNLTKLTFTMNNVVFFAFYAENGDLLALTRNILSTQLPVNLMISLKNDYSGYWINELFEFNGDGQNSYYISLENTDTKMTLRSTDNKNWEVYGKTSKN